MQFLDTFLIASLIAVLGKLGNAPKEMAAPGHQKTFTRTFIVALFLRASNWAINEMPSNHKTDK